MTLLYIGKYIYLVVTYRFSGDSIQLLRLYREWRLAPRLIIIFDNNFLIKKRQKITREKRENVERLIFLEKSHVGAIVLLDDELL